MTAPQRRAKVLAFQSAESWARQGAEIRLQELLAEADEIESWLNEADNRQQQQAVSFAGRHSDLALVKR